MVKSIKNTDSLVNALGRIEKKIDILIAFTAAQSKQSPEKSIRMLYKMGMGYDDIEKLLGVSSKTISKEIKK